MQNSFTLKQQIAETKELLIYKNNCAQVAQQQVITQASGIPTHTSKGFSVAAAIFGTEAVVLQAKLRKLEQELKKMEQANDNI